MRSQQEIENEIKALEEMKPNVRHHTIFGDDNHAAIDAQLSVLRLEIDEDDIQDAFDNDEFTDHERSHAQDAHDWLMEDTDEESPSEQWKELVE